MNTDFNKIEIEDFIKNPFTLIAKDWMLIAAGLQNNCNGMTASWGGVGHLWEKYVAYCFIRPVRYTYQFVESNDFFSINFLNESYRKALNLFGKQSGRNLNKFEAAGITAFEDEIPTVYVKEADLVLICKKIYFQDLIPSNFLDISINSFYPKKDYHRMYVGEIIKVLEKPV